jgi:hypothetical protein
MPMEAQEFCEIMSDKCLAEQPTAIASWRSSTLMSRGVLEEAKTSKPDRRSRTKSLLDLLGVDWKIGAGGYPRLGMLAKAGLLKFRDDTLDATVFLDIVLNERQCLGADDAAQYSL